MRRMPFSNYYFQVFFKYLFFNTLHLGSASHSFSSNYTIECCLLLYQILRKFLNKLGSVHNILW